MKGEPAIYMWDMSGLGVAIPKRRGKGYMSVPIGHHANSRVSEMETDEADMCGLDGYVQISYGYVNYEDRQEIVDRVMPKLAKHFGFTEWIEDDDKFWEAVMT